MHACMHKYIHVHPLISLHTRKRSALFSRWPPVQSVRGFRGEFRALAAAFQLLCAHVQDVSWPYMYKSINKQYMYIYIYIIFQKYGYPKPLDFPLTTTKFGWFWNPSFEEPPTYMSAFIQMYMYMYVCICQTSCTGMGVQGRLVRLGPNICPRCWPLDTCITHLNVATKMVKLQRTVISSAVDGLVDGPLRNRGLTHLHDLNVHNELSFVWALRCWHTFPRTANSNRTDPEY